MTAKRYNPKEIEKKWQERWNNQPQEPSDKTELTRKKFFCLDMFPYPSGSGLHVGHVENYTATNILCRYKTMNGFDVFHPMGWDAFGLPAENYAIKMGIHPQLSTEANIKTYKRQMNDLGLTYDWSQEINTSSPEYYRWTQWFFLLLHKHGLAYKGIGKLNWCDSCQTVLANEQAENGTCERCSSLVTQKEMKQWFFKVTDFIEDQEGVKGLINGLDSADWPNSTEKRQREWIGKSTGVQFLMKIAETDLSLEVFTTRIDTIFGMTYAVIAPEHPIVEALRDKIENLTEVDAYIATTQTKTESERLKEKEKTGIELKGVRVINPFTKSEVPVFMADYILAHYGTGSIMAVPAHDKRDFEFANKYSLPIKTVVQQSPDDNQVVNDEVFTGEGILINSGNWTGMTSEKAQDEMAKALETVKIGKIMVNYKLRDWTVSRQRYWGAPIPIIHCNTCGDVPVPEEDLPVLLPGDVNFKPTGESPLTDLKEFHNVNCPNCGQRAKRDSDTLDTFVCSSWYFLRFADPHNSQEFASREAIKQWLPVDFYMGGAEHAVLHLIYARFFTKVLKKFGYIDFDEPFLKLRHQGVIRGEDGRKMSKSIGNIVNPDEMVEQFGADALRLYEMFMAPLEEEKDWNTKSIIGLQRFLERIWKLQFKVADTTAIPKSLETLLHITIKKVTLDIEDLHYNTAISALMILLNSMEKEKSISAQVFRTYITLLFPFAPHITEEVWENLGNKESLQYETWPKWNEENCQQEKAVIVVMIDGKKRATFEMSTDESSDEEKVREQCFNVPRLEFLKNHEILSTVFVADKLINFVITKKEK